MDVNVRCSDFIDSIFLSVLQKLIEHEFIKSEKNERRNVLHNENFKTTTVSENFVKSPSKNLSDIQNIKKLKSYDKYSDELNKDQNKNLTQSVDNTYHDNCENFNLRNIDVKLETSKKNTPISLKEFSNKDKEEVTLSSSIQKAKFIKIKDMKKLDETEYKLKDLKNNFQIKINKKINSDENCKKSKGKFNSYKYDDIKINNENYSSPQIKLMNSNGYLYIKENKLSRENVLKISKFEKKLEKKLFEDPFKNALKFEKFTTRNMTAKNFAKNNKIIGFESDSEKKVIEENFEKRIFSSNTNKLNKNKKKFIDLMNNPKNPYSLFWSNKILSKNFNVSIAINSYLNGVPIFKLVKNKKIEQTLISKKIVSLNNVPIINSEIEFNTNKKNFYKARKDIQEDPLECPDNINDSGIIEFPLIMDYLKNK